MVFIKRLLTGYILDLSHYNFLLKLFSSAAIGGSVDSNGVKAIMRSVGQNPSDAEIAVWYGKYWAYSDWIKYRT